jgi:hypothetical protein
VRTRCCRACFGRSAGRATRFCSGSCQISFRVSIAACSGCSNLKSARVQATTQKCHENADERELEVICCAGSSNLSGLVVRPRHWRYYSRIFRRTLAQQPRRKQDVILEQVLTMQDPENRIRNVKVQDNNNLSWRGQPNRPAVSCQRRIIRIGCTGKKRIANEEVADEQTSSSQTRRGSSRTRRRSLVVGGENEENGILRLTCYNHETRQWAPEDPSPEAEV